MKFIAGVDNFGYDWINRLTSAVVSSGYYGGTGSAPYTGTNLAGATLAWSYDQLGNRLTQSSSSAALPTGSTQFSAANNQAAETGLTSSPLVSTVTLAYDASGDLLGPTGTASPNISDAEGRLCATPANSGGYEGYLYDAGGNRVAKGTLTSASCDFSINSQTGKPNNGFALTSQYLLGPSGEQMTELNATGAWVHTNVTADGTLFATFDNDGKGVHFFLDDWLGTRRVQTDYLGAVENTWTSLPYGDALTPSGTDDPTEQHFTGKERDTESGLDYFGARYYASNMGRFMSPDWAVKEEPVPYAKLEDPQSLNLYAYVVSNPLIHSDADGHDCAGSYGSACAAQAFAMGATGETSWTPAQGTQNKKTAQQNGVQDKRDALAAAALEQAKKKSTAWSDTAPPCAGPKCNLFVAAMLKAVGIGQEKAPLAGDWATPGKTPKGWEMLPLGATPAPGDIAAYAHSGWSDAAGHVGIVTAIDSHGIQVVATSGTHVYSTHDFNADQPNEVVRYSRYVGVP